MRVMKNGRAVALIVALIAATAAVLSATGRDNQTRRGALSKRKNSPGSRSTAAATPTPAKPKEEQKAEDLAEKDAEKFIKNVNNARRRAAREQQVQTKEGALPSTTSSRRSSRRGTGTSHTPSRLPTRSKKPRTPSGNEGNNLVEPEPTPVITVTPAGNNNGGARRDMQSRRRSRRTGGGGPGQARNDPNRQGQKKKRHQRTFRRNGYMEQKQALQPPRSPPRKASRRLPRIPRGVPLNDDDDDSKPGSRRSRRSGRSGRGRGGPPQAPSSGANEFAKGQGGMTQRGAPLEAKGPGKTRGEREAAPANAEIQRRGTITRRNTESSYSAKGPLRTIEESEEVFMPRDLPPGKFYTWMEYVESRRKLRSHPIPENRVYGSVSGEYIELVDSIPIDDYEPLPSMYDDQMNEDWSFIQKGSEGEIFRIRPDPSKPDEMLAIKCVKRGNSAISYDEVDLMSSMKSKYVSRIYDKYKDDNFLYYTMDYAVFGDGFDMVHALHSYYTGYQEDPLKPYHMEYHADRELVVKMAIFDIVRGLMELHSHGYVHHDVKWENTLAFRNFLQLVDFGISYTLVREGVENRRFGTLKTLPPETLDGLMYDDRSDIWSLGVITFEMMFGYNPFEDEDDPGNMELTEANIIDYGKCDFQIHIGHYLSKSGKAFVRRCLLPIGLRFQNIFEVYNHPWFDEIRYLDVTDEYSPWIDIKERTPLEKGREKLAHIRKACVELAAARAASLARLQR